MVLELIRLRGSVSRAELSRITGLQKSTISIIADHLLSSGWVREYTSRLNPHQEETGPGRRPTQLSIDDSLAVIAVDIRPGRTAIAAVDLDGRVLSQDTFPTPARASQAEDGLAQAASILLARHPQQAFQGVGVSVPGRVNSSTGLLEFAPNLPWRSWNPAQNLHSKLGLPVEARNAAEAIVLSERWFGSFRGVQDALVITVSEGIGVGILTGGRDLLGAHGLAGEFGHVVLDHSGPLCGCGKRGCWEAFASNRAAEQLYAKRRGRSAHKKSYADILALAEAGNAVALEVIQEQYRRIGDGLRLVLPFAPESILFAGDFVAHWSRFGNIIAEDIKRNAMPSRIPALLRSADSTAARLRGATALILQSIYKNGIKTAARPIQ